MATDGSLAKHVEPVVAHTVVGIGMAVYFVFQVPEKADDDVETNIVENQNKRRQHPLPALLSTEDAFRFFTRVFNTKTIILS